MQLKEFGVCLGDLIQEFDFEVVYGPENFETRRDHQDRRQPSGASAGRFL